MLKTYVFLSTAIIATVAATGAAFATDPTSPQELAGTAATNLTPIVLGVAAALIALAGIAWGVRMVFRAVSSGGKRAGV
jgi:2-keto-3-deoxy-6-phosphogluconate aldolase